MNLTVLRFGIDTLDASIGGNLRPYVAKLLHDTKLKAQETEEPQYTPLGGLDFRLGAQGAAPYKYKLVGDEATIKASDSESDKLPGAFVHLSALGLALYEPRMLYELLWQIVTDCLGPSTPEKISRLDIAVDFQGFNVARAIRQGQAKFVCPAMYRPIFPSIENPETFHFGKDELVVRVYNKTKEIKKSHKYWTEELWKGNPEYRKGQEVWRFEVQMRRETLRRLGCETPQDAIAKAPELLAYGLSWCDLRIPHGESSDRWERHEAWKALEKASGTTNLLARAALEQRLAHLESIVPAVAGYAVSAGAFLNSHDFDRVWAILEPKVREHVGDSFAKQVRTRRLERMG